MTATVLVPPKTVRGDWNGDGVLDVADRLIAGRSLLEGKAPEDLSIADMNGDGTFDVGDLSELSREIVSGS